MSQRTRIAVVGAVLMSTVLIVPVVLRVQREARKSQMQSTMSAVAAALLSYAQAEPERVEELTSPGPEWHALSESQYDALIRSLATLYPLDPPVGWNRGTTLVDNWGRRFEISVQRRSDRKINVAVSSWGPDGRRGTTDDVRSPGSGDGVELRTREKSEGPIDCGRGVRLPTASA